MGGGGTTSTTSSTQSSDPQVKSTLDQLLKGVSTAYTNGPTYVAPGATTQQGWGQAISAANNPDYQQGVSTSLGDVNNLLNRQGLTFNQRNAVNDNLGIANLYGQMANDPSSTQAGRNLINSVTTNTNSAFNNSGLFGSDNNQTALSQGLTQGLGSLQQSYLQGQQGALGDAFNELQQGTNNIGSLSQLLPSIYQASQLPSGTISAVGSAQDQAAQNAANKNLSLLSNLSSILYGSGSLAGTTTTQTQPSTPLWQSILGAGISLL